MAAPRPGTPADAVLGVVPRTVLVPETVQEAVAAVGALARDRMRVAFVGGGTDLEMGAPPEGLDAVLRTERLTRIVEHAPSDQIVVVESGLPLAELQRHLSSHGQRLAIDPPHPERATAGGIVAANAFGPLRTRYGSARDLIIGVSLVRADGVLARGGGKVVKNVAGFDLPRLMVGSLGTLGLIATVTFRLHPLPESAATLVFPKLDAARVWGLAREMRSRQLEPVAAAALSAGGGLDLGVRFEGFGPGVAQQSERLLELARGAGHAAERLDEAGARAFWERHDRIRAAGPLRARLASPPAALPAVARDAVEPLLGALPGGALAWYPTLGLGFANGAPASAEAVRTAVERARPALHGLGGSLVLAAAPREVRAVVDVWGPPPPSIGLMRSLKARLDPERRLAPGRFVGGI